MNSSLPDDLYNVALKHDLMTFTDRAFHDLRPGMPFLQSRYLEVIASHLEYCRQGKIRRLIINLPPRHSKSLLASIAFPAWLLGHDPGVEIICASYGQDLSDGFARDCRTIMSSSWYRHVFQTRLTRTVVHDLATSKKGTRFATSVGGVLTGRGGDVIIIDDPAKPDEALSDAKRKTASQWLDNTLLSRLNSQDAGVIIVLMQRLHMDDLTGHLLEGGGWTALRLPAIAEEDEAIPFNTLLGPAVFRRRCGEALHPERFSIAALEQLRSSIGSYDFSSQYQQNPVPIEGNLVKRSWLARYTAAEREKPFEMILQSWDTASKSEEVHDFSVCTTWGVRNRTYYLLDVYRRRLEFPDLKRAVRDQARRFGAKIILIEDRSSGIQLIQDLKREGLIGVKGIDPSGSDKVMRLYAHTASFECGRVLLPEAAHWLDDYIDELTGFPGSRHADQVDSTTQALTYLQNAPRGMVITDELLRKI